MLSKNLATKGKNAARLLIVIYNVILRTCVYIFMYQLDVTIVSLSLLSYKPNFVLSDTALDLIGLNVLFCFLSSAFHFPSIMSSISFNWL